MRSYEIRLTTPGFEKAVAQLNSLAVPARRIDALFQKLVTGATGLDAATRKLHNYANEMERIQKATGAIAAPGGGGGGGASVKGSPGVRKSRQFASGPHQQLAEAMQQLEAAKAAGNPLAKLDADYRISLRERSIALHQKRKNDPEHLTRPGLLELFSDLNNLMRGFKNGNFGSTVHSLASLSKNQAGGINMQQLLGQGGLIGGKPGGASGGAMGSAMAARAVGLAVNPVTIGAAAAVAQITAMAVAAKAAAGALTAVRASASAAGASPGEVAALRAMGIDPGAVPGLGASLRSKLSSDPFAMAIGGYAAPSHLTGESDAKLVRQQLDRLRGLHDEGRTLEMVRQARVLGMEAYLDELQVSRKIREEMLASARVAQRVFGDTGKTQAARDYEASLKLINNEWQAMSAQIGAGAMGGLTLIFKDLAAVMRVMAEAESSFPDWFKLFRAFTLGGPIWGALEALGLIGKQSGNDPKVQAQNANTEAMRDLAAVLQGIVGGGPRARGALSPSQRAAALRGDQLNAARDLRAFRL